MRKWNRFMVAASAVAVMGIFTGCASKASGTSTEASAESASTEAVTIQESSADDMTAKQPETIDERELVSEGETYGNPVTDVKKMVEDFGSLLGQADDKTVFLLGEGTANEEDNGSVSSRQYSMKVLEHETVTDVLYNEGKVVGVQLVLDGADMDASQKQLDEIFGTAGAATKSTNDGSAIESVIWEVSGCEVELLHSYGTVSIQITPAL